MNKEDLRPIGTEFDIEYPPAVSSTDPMGHKVRYRVRAHSLCARFPHDPNPVWGEEWECLSREEVMPNEVRRPTRTVDQWVVGGWDAGQGGRSVV